ncbi:XrtA system polysaccharide deacetylase, partial [Magnetococcales bacterium HHB-1]
WSDWPHRVERNTEIILDLFNQFNVKATFFTLGWVAKHYPKLIERIVKEGHELASHGWQHIRVTEQTPDTFFQDISRTKKQLEDLSGVEVRGYRAASYSIGKKNLWALDKLLEAGYHYSSSIYPIHHDHYGMPQAPRFAFRYHQGKLQPALEQNNQGLLEIPITTTELLNRRIPCGGGGYFRFFPYRFSRWMLQRVNQQENQPALFYFHPWEIDPQQPRPKDIPAKTRFRHYLNLDKMEKRLTRLLQDFHWQPIEQLFSDLLPEPSKKRSHATKNISTPPTSPNS